MNRALLESGRQNWATPILFFRWLDACFRFTVDAAAEKWSAKVRRFWDLETNALRQDWSKDRIFDNPPYDRVGEFLEVGKAGARAGGLSAHLVATRPDTAWWRGATEEGWGRLRRSYYHQASRVLWFAYAEGTVGIYHHDERLTFVLPEAERQARIAKGKDPDEPAPFPSSVLIFGPPGSEFERVIPRRDARAELAAVRKFNDRPLLLVGRPSRTQRRAASWE